MRSAGLAAVRHWHRHLNFHFLLIPFLDQLFFFSHDLVWRPSFTAFLMGLRGIMFFMCFLFLIVCVFLFFLPFTFRSRISAWLLRDISVALCFVCVSAFCVDQDTPSFLLSGNLIFYLFTIPDSAMCEDGMARGCCFALPTDETNLNLASYLFQFVGPL